jgi:hypothetical protein
MDDCRIARQVAEWNPQGKRRCDRPVSTWKDGIRDSMQRRNLKGIEFFDRELRRKKIVSPGGVKLYSHKNSYMNIYIHTSPHFNKFVLTVYIYD